MFSIRRSTVKVPETSAIDQTAAASMPSLSPAAGRFRTLVVLSGAAVLMQLFLYWNSVDVIKYAVFLTVAIGLSNVGIQSQGRYTFPLSVFFVLFAIEDLSYSEAVFLSIATGVAQAIWDQRRGRSTVGPLFQVALVATSTALAARIFDSMWLVEAGLHPILRLGIASLALFLVGTVPLAGISALDYSRKFSQVWYSNALWSLPYYLGAAVLAHLTSVTGRMFGWPTVLLTGPVIYLVYRTYCMYLHRLQDEKRHTDDMSALHLRTIEALALAIEAKDHTTHDHLQRVQIYAREIGKDLGLTDKEQQALQAAALLHDIGKLAVPEHIISKPGKLTPEEFEKMKIHPIVGAEILERVRFPYPVAPIVRAHHEKWDGTGYPAGISGEAIPIGARILAVVDCLDALATDRQYRRAMPLDEAMKVIERDSGKAFDPRVVQVLMTRYVELERMAQGSTPKQSKLSTEVKVELGAAPGAGFESMQSASSTGVGGEQPVAFLTSIAAARQEVQTLFEISQDLGNSLSLDETLSILNVRLRRIIPHHALAIWLRKEDTLVPAYVNGEDYRLFSSLQIPIGEGLSGWVAENGKPIVNGNPSVEPGYLNDPTICSTLRSAVAIPLEGNSGIAGVLTLYHLERDAFTRDHLRILAAINTKIGMAIENALRFRQAESTATTDFMTSLPNARSLFLQLDSELARAKRGGLPMTVAVLDMDGLKMINDRLGHLEGNRVLGSVAQGLKAACREYDYVARMGGDEFVVLLPGLKAADTQMRIEHLRQVVAQAGIGLFPDKNLSASIGIASYPADGTAADQLLAEADKRMYAEKRQRKEARNTEPHKDWAQQISTLQSQ
ncbi:MAG: HD domain-containing phosphohydrolase [Acidobacteriota bacterium]